MAKVENIGIERRFDESQNALVLQASDFSLQGLKEMVDNNVIDLSPKYQRRERWEPERQSQLIESFLLNVPVPPIYLAEETYGVYSIIDGKQRITSISEYMNDRFSLKGLEAFPQINGLKFSQLPKSLQGALRIRPYIRVITLLKQSHPQLKYEVFMRLNRGGIQLNNQEIRNVAFRGSLNDAIYKCAEHPLLKAALKIDGPQSSAFKQMTDAEFVLRFFTLHGIWENFSGSLLRSMDDFMIENQYLNGKRLDSLVKTFDTAIRRTDKLWGEIAFQRWDGSKWRQQALAGMFDAQMIAASKLTALQVDAVASRKKDLLRLTKKLFDSNNFQESVRLGTNTPARLKLRIEETYKMLVQLSK